MHDPKQLEEHLTTEARRHGGGFFIGFWSSRGCPMRDEMMNSLFSVTLCLHDEVLVWMVRRPGLQCGPGS
jgi:hypothetical protein